MLERNGLKKKDLEFLKKLFAKPEEKGLREETIVIKKPQMISTTREARDKVTTVTTTRIVEREALETIELTPLIQENIIVLRSLTKYLKSMDSSLKILSKGPIKVEVVR